MFKLVACCWSWLQVSEHCSMLWEGPGRADTSNWKKNVVGCGWTVSWRIFSVYLNFYPLTCTGFKSTVLNIEHQNALQEHKVWLIVQDIPSEHVRTPDHPWTTNDTYLTSCFVPPGLATFCQSGTASVLVVQLLQPGSRCGMMASALQFIHNPFVRIEVISNQTHSKHV